MVIREIHKNLKWTPAALDCYNLGCNCKKCIIKQILTSTKCHMKGVVLELVRRYGIPTEEDKKTDFFEKPEIDK